MFKLVKKWQRNQRSNCQHPLDHQKGKRVPEKHLFLLYWLCQSFDGVNHNKLWKILKVKVKVKSLSRVRLFATPWTVAHKAPLSMGFSRQEYWSGLLFPSPGESFQPRDWTRVSCIAGRRFNLWPTREVRWVQLCGSLSILWHFLSLGLEWKLTFSSPVATA